MKDKLIPTEDYKWILLWILLFIGLSWLVVEFFRRFNLSNLNF